jgi:hypothetical protein
MRESLRLALQRELAFAEEHRRAREYEAAFARLERAHILSQRHAFGHAGVHLQMWRLGWERRDLREVTGQLPRILAALLFSRLWVPLGNTGGANVSAFRPMPVPADLRTVLDAQD